jgi:SAM-dependent methyltransferase
MDVSSSYDAAAAPYAERFDHELEHKPLDRALLAAFAASLPPGSPVLDAGCGPGHVAAHLAALGLRPTGLDLSPRMIEQARVRHPGIEFEPGSMLAIPHHNGALAAVVAFYSIIHLTPDELQTALQEFHRVLRPGGQLLLAVHVGDEIRHADELCGVAVDLDFRFHRTEALRQHLERAGMRVDAVLERRAYIPHEVDTRRGYILASRPIEPGV